MIYTLTGPNSFMLQARLREIIAAYVSEYTDMALERLDGEDAGYDRMRESLESLPFLAAKKLVVLRAPSADKQFIEQAESLLANVSDTTDVVIVEPKLDKRLSYAKFLKKDTTYQEFLELDMPQLSKWLVGEVKTRQGTIDVATASMLITRVGSNQQLLSNEIDKLLQYSPAITKETVLLLTDQAPQSSTFDLLDAALAGNAKKAIGLYHDQRAQKVEVVQMIALLAWQLHVLAIVKSAGGKDSNTIAKDAKLNPYVVRKTASLANRLSMVQISSLISNVQRIDMRLKSEAVDPDEIFMQLLIDMGEL